MKFFRFSMHKSSHDSVDDSYGALASNSEISIDYPESNKVDKSTVLGDEGSTSTDENSFAGDEDGADNVLLGSMYDAIEAKDDVQNDLVVRQVEKKETRVKSARSHSFDPDEIGAQVLSVSGHGRSRVSKKSITRSESFADCAITSKKTVRRSEDQHKSQAISQSNHAHMDDTSADGNDKTREGSLFLKPQDPSSEIPLRRPSSGHSHTRVSKKSITRSKSFADREKLKSFGEDEHQTQALSQPNHTQMNDASTDGKEKTRDGNLFSKPQDPSSEILQKRSSSGHSRRRVSKKSITRSTSFADRGKTNSFAEDEHKTQALSQSNHTQMNDASAGGKNKTREASLFSKHQDPSSEGLHSRHSSQHSRHKQRSDSPKKQPKPPKETRNKTRKESSDNLEALRSSFHGLVNDDITAVSVQHRGERHESFLQFTLE